MSINIPTYLRRFISEADPVKIPKIIHQTYKSIEGLPKEWKQTPESWKKFNPAWKYKFWSDKDLENLVRKSFPWFLETWLSYPYHIQRVDAARPMILYCYAGIYADMDFLCQKSVDDLFYDDNSQVWLVESPNGNCITNSIMASKRRAPFWLYVLSVMRDRALNPNPLWVSKHILVMNTTGPALIDDAYHEWSARSKKAARQIALLPQAYLFPEECDVCADKPCGTRESYTKILQGSSWCEADSGIIQWIYCNRTLLFTIVLGLAITIFIFYCQRLWRKRIKGD